MSLKLNNNGKKIELSSQEVLDMIEKALRVVMTKQFELEDDLKGLERRIEKIENKPERIY